MPEIFHRFCEEFTHHLATKQREDVEEKNWVKPLLCLQRVPLSISLSISFHYWSITIRTSPDFGMTIGNFRSSYRSQDEAPCLFPINDEFEKEERRGEIKRVMGERRRDLSRGDSFR